jgi:aspartyl-tRNA(Asn)/glutamyl-tRNA(Gln) amidotransferase subunit A
VPDYVAGLARGARGLRIGVPTRFFTDCDDDTRRLLADAERVFASLGALVVKVDPPDMDRLNAFCSMVISCEAVTIHREWLRTRPQDYGDQVRARLEAGLMIPAAYYLDAMRARGPMLDDFGAKVFGQCDMMLAPVTDSAAPTIDETAFGPGPDLGVKLGRFTKFTRCINYLGLPGLSVPAGFAASGLPVGFQLVGRAFDEATLFAAGHAYQQATDWHLRVPG